MLLLKSQRLLNSTASFAQSLKDLHRRPRNGVILQIVINVNEHTRIGPLIKRRWARTTRNLRPTTTDHNINALWVILRAIIAPRAVQGDHLMAKHIRASFQRRRDGDDPRVVVLHQVVLAPVAGRRAAQQADFAQFGEFESALVGCRAVVVGACGDVVDHGALVAGWPGVPVELHGLACHHGDVRAAWFAGFVADDVGALVGVWCYLGDRVRYGLTISRNDCELTKPESSAVVDQPATGGGLL